MEVKIKFGKNYPLLASPRLGEEQLPAAVIAVPSSAWGVRLVGNRLGARVGFVCRTYFLTAINPR